MIYALIGLSGAIGALLRYGLGLLVPFDISSSFPFATLLTNWLGCFCLGWFLTAAHRRSAWGPLTKAAIGTGLIGSFTTFSTFSVETLRLGVEEHRWLTAILYVLLSVWGGLALAWYGNRTAEPRYAQPESGEPTS